MAVNNGQRANQTTFNDAFVSRTVDSDSVGRVGLNHPTSGGLIANAQQQINDNDVLSTSNAARITVNEGDIDSLELLKEDKANKDIANGYAGLDGTGRISASALPTTTLEFKGVWDASTNTPTLIDGTGTNGDIYRVSVAATRDLGSGNQTFVVGDWVTYNGTIWERSDFGLDVQVLDDLTDVDTTSTAPVADDVLQFDGSEWAPAALASAGGLTVSTESSSFTAAVQTFNIIDTSSGNVTATLPSAVTNVNKEIGFYIDDDTNKLIIDGDGAQTIDGSLTFELRSEKERLIIISDGSNWRIKESYFTEFIENALTVNTATASAGVSVDITGAGITLDIGRFTLGYDMPVFLNYISGAGLGVFASVIINDPTPSAIGGTGSYMYKDMSGNTDEVGMFLSNEKDVIVTANGLYKCTVICNQNNANATAVIDITSTLGDGKFWARRIG